MLASNARSFSAHVMRFGVSGAGACVGPEGITGCGAGVVMVVVFVNGFCSCSFILAAVSCSRCSSGGAVGCCISAASCSCSAAIISASMRAMSSSVNCGVGVVVGCSTSSSLISSWSFSASCMTPLSTATRMVAPLS